MRLLTTGTAVLEAPERLLTTVEKVLEVPGRLFTTCMRISARGRLVTEGGTVLEKPGTLTM